MFIHNLYKWCMVLHSVSAVSVFVSVFVCVCLSIHVHVDVQDADGDEQTREKRKLEAATQAKFGIKNAVLGFVFGVSVH